MRNGHSAIQAFTIIVITTLGIAALAGGGANSVKPNTEQAAGRFKK
jgi:hypothetical protein